MIDISLIEQTDPEIAEALKLELSRQQNFIELIASENFVSPAVLAVAGSHLTNNTPRAIPPAVITADANAWTSPKSLR